MVPIPLTPPSKYERKEQSSFTRFHISKPAGEYHTINSITASVIQYSNHFSSHTLFTTEVWSHRIIRSPLYNISFWERPSTVSIGTIHRGHGIKHFHTMLLEKDIKTRSSHPKRVREGLLDKRDKIDRFPFNHASMLSIMKHDF